MNTLLTLENHTYEINIVRRYLTAFGENNIQEALDCIHEDAIWHIDGDSVVKTVGIIKGHNAIMKWLLNFPTAFKPLNFSIERVVNIEQDVFVTGRFRHLVLKTDTIVDSDYIIKFTIADQKIIRYQIFEDSLLVSQTHRSQSSSRKVDINGTTYSWDDVGNGPSIIFLHGLFLDRTFWDLIVKQISDYRCITFDMPGHANSGWRDFLDLDGIAEDIVIWMKEYQIEKVTLVGHSQGGMIAMRIAAKYPEMIDRLVLVNTSAQKEYEDRMPLWAERSELLLSTNANRLQVFKEVQAMKFAPEWLENNPEIAEEELVKMMKHQPGNLANSLKSTVINRTDIRDIIQRIRAKTVVLSGEQDQATPSELGQEIADLIPGAVHKKIFNVSHSIPIEAPDEVLNIILNLVD
ncbi:alpha/beta fold hydrolase [Acinetobacter sp. 2JN-4]|uniref:alpha/beta fold hydrolase n=1 Tax=Acinetobacter sp. 2JN-4 TaxID=2479844 RepID=UPI000EF9DE93|nr:alpha/beta fold hydrolase [Acinetobacter sp. 2JN-4]RLZ08783.1 alpha/beta fold hydrolase [Acinetobacter sp. 2JN-4]